jgi:hypothetical protein
MRTHRRVSVDCRTNYPGDVTDEQGAVGFALAAQDRPALDRPAMDRQFDFVSVAHRLPRAARIAATNGLARKITGRKRHIAVDRDYVHRSETSETSKTMIYIAMIAIMSRRLTRQGGV